MCLVVLFLPTFPSPLPYNESNRHRGSNRDDGENIDAVLDIKHTEQPPLNGHNAHRNDQG